jgi:hypothetical protein
MSNRLFKSLLGLGCVAILSTSALAAPNSGGCAAVGVSTSPATVTAGYGVGIYGSINNCSSRRERYTVVVSARSDCGQKTTIASFRMAFNPGENRLYGVSHTTTANSCAGPCDVTVEVFDGQTMLTSASKTFTIVE